MNPLCLLEATRGLRASLLTILAHDSSKQLVRRRLVRWDQEPSSKGWKSLAFWACCSSRRHLGEPGDRLLSAEGGLGSRDIGEGIGSPSTSRKFAPRGDGPHSSLLEPGRGRRARSPSTAARSRRPNTESRFAACGIRSEEPGYAGAETAPLSAPCVSAAPRHHC